MTNVGTVPGDPYGVAVATTTPSTTTVWLESGDATDLSREGAERLAELLASQAHGMDDLVFTAPMGGPLRASKFVPNYFKPAPRAAGLPDSIRFYDLRHTCASLLIREDASIKAVQKQMGHATAAMTLDVYGHRFPDELDSIAERLDQVRADALEARRLARVWPQRGPAVASITESAGQGS